MDGFLSSVVSALIGAAVAYVGSLVTAAIEGRRRIDEQLYDRRVESYRRVWQHTAVIPKWPRASELTYEALAELSSVFRDWYFADGGMYLSHEARQAYGKMQKILARVTGAGKTGKVPDVNYDDVQRKCSAFRTELTSDLLSRSRSMASGWFLTKINKTA